MRFSARYLAVTASVITTTAWAGPSAAESPAGSVPPPPAAAALPQPAPTPAPVLTPEQAKAAAVEARIVVVHLASKERMRLDRRADPSSPWVEVCWTPCDTRTWADATYRVVGEGLMPSAPFALPAAQGGRVDLEVHPGSQMKRGLGIGLLIGGLVLTSAGGIVQGFGATGTTTVDGVTRSNNQDLLTLGTVLLVAGVGTALGGGTYVFQNMASEVVPMSAAQPPPATPTTHGAAPTLPAGVAMSLPLLSGSF